MNPHSPSLDTISSWLEKSIELSKATSYRNINRSLVQHEENKVNKKRNLAVIRGFEDRSLFGQYDRYREIGEIAEESISKLQDLAHEVDYATIKEPKLHFFKNKLAKLISNHSKTLGLLNGLKQSELFSTLSRMIEDENDKPKSA
ncbi:unnamed protein product [Blepharisma stoltei]|uniref:Uncharacterized protein n=1 Tax=Blepharisma stoltei TaxID=1481888 RepID=A0AAU9ISJ6_9CILI|nr:unnamed protein product [Blepharisma stoltei]